jgi:hypothetical protein
MRAASRAAVAAEDSAEHARRSADAAQDALTYQQAQLERERRARLIPHQELLDLLLHLHRDFNDILAGQGVESAWFLEPHRQDRSAHLAAIAGQIVDEQLNELVGTARDRYMSCWSHAPGHNMLRNDTTQVQQQVNFAGEGVTLVKQAIDQYNLLVFPVLLGAGKSAFPQSDRDRQKLRLRDADSYANGVAKLVYDVVR